MRVGRRLRGCGGVPDRRRRQRRPGGSRTCGRNCCRSSVSAVAAVHGAAESDMARLGLPPGDSRGPRAPGGLGGGSDRLPDGGCSGSWRRRTRSPRVLPVQRGHEGRPDARGVRLRLVAAGAAQQHGRTQLGRERTQRLRRPGVAVVGVSQARQRVGPVSVRAYRDEQDLRLPAGSCRPVGPRRGRARCPGRSSSRAPSTS